jgi:hypothetical protein
VANFTYGFFFSCACAARDFMMTMISGCVIISTNQSWRHGSASQSQAPAQRCNQSVSSPCALESDLSRLVVDNFFFASIFFREQYFVFAGMFRKNLFLHQLLEFIG